MRFGSVCSGIEAASVASAPLGWEAAWFSEIEPFPCAVLAHHYSDVPNHGDMTKLSAYIASGIVEAPELFVGGTPCQAFSVAGHRKGLEDARGNLTLVFCEIADAIDEARARRGEQPTIVFWENVPGVLSDKSNAFGCFLGKLAGEDCELQPPGKKWENAGVVVGPTRTIAWRVLDAQYFGVAQRRKRVFVVASARKDFDPVSVLFEFDGVRRDFDPSYKEKKRITTFAESSFGAFREDEIAGTTKASGGVLGGGSETLAVAFDAYNISINNYTSQTLSSSATDINHTGGVINQMKIRRLTPTECERLQGFPDNYTNIPWRKSAESPDGPRYKALGNSWAVPCVAWIFKRIADATA